MKKLNLLSIWAIALTMLASCSFETDDMPANQDGKVVFNAEIVSLNGTTHNTKAHNTQWDANDEIGVYALNKDGVLPAGVYDSKENVKFVTNGDGKFNAVGDKIEYPINGDALDFIAYYPYQAVVTDYKIPVDVASQNFSDIDVLYSNNAKNVNQDAPEANLQFSHKLTMLVLNVKAGTNVTSLDGLTVKEEGLVTDGKLDLKNGVVALESAKAIINPAITDNGEDKVATAILVPGQDMNTAKFTFTLGSDVYEWTPETQALESGKKYVYILTLNGSGVTPPAKVEVTASATILPWDEVTKDDVTLNPKAGDKFEADKANVTFTAAAGNETVHITTQDDQAWTATSDQTWLTVTASGTGSADVTLTAEENTAAAERTATVTLKATGFDDITVTVTQAGAGTPPAPGATLAFAGSDFEDWTAFEGALSSYGLKNYATQSTEGKTGSALKLEGTPTGNDYVFTTVVPAEGSAFVGKSKIVFYIKGTNPSKSLSFNVYHADGSAYSKFNLKDLGAEDKVLEPEGNNSYTGSIDTQGNWVKVTLNISGIDFSNTADKNQFSLKIGKNSACNLLIDDITVE